MEEPQKITEHSTGKGKSVWAGASLVAALIASACCLGPVVLSALGLSALGVSALFEPMRPYFLGVTVLLLGVGFYFAYFRQLACQPGTACSVPNPKLTRGLLWVTTIAVLTIALIPTYVGSLFAGSTAPVEAISVDGAATVTLQVEGMTCGACTVSVQQALAKVPGVQSAVVNYEEARAVVTIEGMPPPTMEALIAAVESVGYTASRESESDVSSPKGKTKKH